MEGIKARIQGDGVESSVEFSVEEVRARHRGKPWNEMNDTEREAEFKDYALYLFGRQNGVAGDLRVSLEGGSFSKMDGRDV